MTIKGRSAAAFALLAGLPIGPAMSLRAQGSETTMSNIREHMRVVGSDGFHVGTVDKVEGRTILLTRDDPASGGEHHQI